MGMKAQAEGCSWSGRVECAAELEPPERRFTARTGRWLEESGVEVRQKGFELVLAERAV